MDPRGHLNWTQGKCTCALFLCRVPSSADAGLAIGAFIGEAGNYFGLMELRIGAVPKHEPLEVNLLVSGTVFLAQVMVPPVPWLWYMSLWTFSVRSHSCAFTLVQFRTTGNSMPSMEFANGPAGKHFLPAVRHDMPHRQSWARGTNSRTC